MKPLFSTLMALVFLGTIYLLGGCGAALLPEGGVAEAAVVPPGLCPYSDELRVKLEALGDAFFARETPEDKAASAVLYTLALSYHECESGSMWEEVRTFSVGLVAGVMAKYQVH